MIRKIDIENESVLQAGFKNSSEMNFVAPGTAFINPIA